MSQEAGDNSNTFPDTILNAEKHYGNGNAGTGTDIFLREREHGNGNSLFFCGNGKRETGIRKVVPAGHYYRSVMETT
jgi:hypothetical protein